MKSFIFFYTLLVMMTTVACAEEAVASAAKPLSLAECFTLALKQSEKVAVQQELITEAEGKFIRVFGAVLPHVSFSSSDKRQDGSGSSAFTLREVPERKFEATQTLFNGFREIAAMRGARAQKRQRIQDRRRAEQLLFLDVANAFYLLLEQQKDFEALGGIRLALLERVHELKEREQLGRSRASEAVSAQARLLRIEAEEEQVRSRVTTARQLLEFLTGTPTDSLSDGEGISNPLEPEETYLVKMDGRADVRSAEEALEVSKKQLAIVQGSFWPTVGLEGNYYVERSGAAQDVNWDAALTVDVPIFEGGQNFGATKEAKAKKRQAELKLAEAKRLATLDSREIYAQLQAALSREAALEKALLAEEENYRLEVEDYRLSLVSNLDVLDALEDLQEARRDLIHAQHETKRLFWQLKVAMGETV